jgi:hypothetical protein
MSRPVPNRLSDPAPEPNTLSGLAPPTPSGRLSSPDSGADAGSQAGLGGVDRQTPDTMCQPTSGLEAGWRALDEAAAADGRPNRRRWLGIGLTVLFVVVGAISRGLGGDASAQPGTCYNPPLRDLDRSAEVALEDWPVVRCDEPHQFEHLLTFDAPSPLESYPTDDAYDALVVEACLPAFEAYTGIAYDLAVTIEITSVVPTEASWNTGDRRIICLLESADGRPVSRSFKAPVAATSSP